MTDSDALDLRISIHVGDDAQLSPRLTDALAEVAAALAAEEVALTDDVADQLASDSDDVVGFNFGKTLKLGDLSGGGLSPTKLDFCGMFDGDGCTIYGHDGPVDEPKSCTLRFW